jgi:hypothetical protein|tara:strand:+ start:1394 stop:2305 length:912 start_codon:yes stop_codon:yes gene_type:complete
MSLSITNAFVEQYRNNVTMLTQQRGSKLRDFVTVNNGVVGKTVFTEQIGATEAKKRISRHGDSPLVDTPHKRRLYTMADYEWGDLIDKADRVRMLIDPTSTYAQSAAFAMGRVMDDVVIDALKGDASIEDAGSQTTVSLSQTVAKTFNDVNSGNDSVLNIAKLRQAQQLFHTANVPDDEEKFIVVSPKGIQQLLGAKEVTSSDFNTVKALVNGEIDTFMGFRFIVSNRLPISSNDRDAFAFTRSAIELGIGQDVMARIEERADKAFSTYVYYCMTLGATRLEEEKVVKITYDESDNVDKSATI